MLRCTEISQLSDAIGQSRQGGAGCRSSHVRNAPLATVGPKRRPVVMQLARTSNIAGKGWRLATMSAGTRFVSRGYSTFKLSLYLQKGSS
jgi:hypothetical protein